MNRYRSMRDYRIITCNIRYYLYNSITFISNYAKPMQNIAKKLLEIQKKNVFIPKTGKNPFTKSNYRKLDDILTIIKPILSDNGIILLQTNTDWKCIVTLFDVDSGEKVESSMDISHQTDPQKVWAMITYYTRYWISWLLGLEVTEDKDWEDAKPNKPKTEWKENRLKVVDHIKDKYNVKTNADVEARLSAIMGRVIKLSEYTESEAKNDLLTLLQ